MDRPSPSPVARSSRGKGNAQGNSQGNNIMSEMKAKLRPFKNYQARHFKWSTDDDARVATITLNRPDKKNPLTFQSYEELRDLFRDLAYASDVRAIVLTGEGGNFCSGG